MSNILNEKILSIADLLPDNYENTVHEALQLAVVDWFRGLNDDNKTRILSNMMYHNVFNIIKEEMPDIADVIKKNVVDKINDKSGYGFYVFGYDGVYNNRPKVGQEIVDRTVKENIATVRQNTMDSISQMSKKDIKEFMVKYQYRQID